MRITPPLVAALAAAVLLAGCGREPAAPAEAGVGQRLYGRIAFKPCSLTSPFAADSIAAQCARFAVPENPAQPKGRQVQLNIAWLPATDQADIAADPVFFLAGGPGQAATEVWPTLDAAFREVRKHRHVILVDQRGTGQSNPLICRNAKGDSAVMEDEATSTEAVVKFAADCAAKLQADPRYYTTTDAVRDLDSVRAALGAAQIDVVGGSYGTRVAQQYAARYPQHTRAVVIDGVVPNELVLGSEHARNLDASLALQFEQCRKNPTCRQRFGDDPRAQLRKLMARLKEQPVEVEYRDPTTGELKRDTATAGAVAGLTRMFAYAPQAAALLPLVLNEADQGRYAPLMSLAQLIQGQVSEQIMHGMQLSVICAEDADLLKDDPADADTVMGSDLSTVLVAQCKVWPTGKRPADFHAPFRSQLPTLVLSGEFDPVTPPRYGEQVLKGLPNGRHLVLRGQGHGSFASGCMPKLMGQFLESADAKSLNAKCLDSLGYVPPFVSFNGWEP
ncbi:alpha/beta hydrolase [Lysobacter silvisoli]|uniref:Alpha/beta hydrolase n=1 Tax=Lysobacter silvisoli TaxID=2293254 RepID=A0A371JY17_9GAMM|nr:alpha/beta hydrolase [Lysobacter silvisoli]RDZ26551.1 alpha/beta hydrolase [Lysobacter silvisoli]